MLAGNQEQPTPQGGTSIGNAGAGYARVSFAGNDFSACALSPNSGYGGVVSITGVGFSGINASDLSLVVDTQATPVTVGDDNHLNFSLPESSTEHTSTITLTYQGNSYQFTYQYLAPPCEGIEHCLTCSAPNICSSCDHGTILDTTTNTCNCPAEVEIGRASCRERV